MSYIYITADRIGGPGGGSTVTFHESEALKTLGPCQVWGRDQIEKTPSVHTQGNPWMWDQRVYHTCNKNFKLAHFYAGTFTSTINKLKQLGCKTV